MKTLCYLLIIALGLGLLLAVTQWGTIGLIGLIVFLVSGSALALISIKI